MAKHGGFPGGMPGMNMNNIMKQYQRMQRKLEETQEELAKALDVVPSTISNWETGKTKPCKKHRNRLRAALHVTEEQLRKELE